MKAMFRSTTKQRLREGRKALLSGLLLTGLAGIFTSWQFALVVLAVTLAAAAAATIVGHSRVANGFAALFLGALFTLGVGTFASYSRYTPFALTVVLMSAVLTLVIAIDCFSGGWLSLKYDLNRRGNRRARVLSLMTVLLLIGMVSVSGSIAASRWLTTGGVNTQRHPVDVAIPVGNAVADGHHNGWYPLGYKNYEFHVKATWSFGHSRTSFYNFDSVPKVEVFLSHEKASVHWDGVVEAKHYFYGCRVGYGYLARWLKKGCYYIYVKGQVTITGKGVGAARPWVKLWIDANGELQAVDWSKGLL